MKLTTLEMLNEAAKNPGVKYYSTTGFGHYYRDGVFFTEHGRVDGSSFNHVMSNKWERKVKPLKGEVTFEMKFGTPGFAYESPYSSLPDAVREALIGDKHNYAAVANKSFKVTIIAEEVTE